MPTAVILMGVAGCGKTSVGQELSEALCWPYYDGDDFHPQTNIDKMAQGIPLDDDDRQPWLERLHALIVEHLDNDENLILSCSALKAQYRHTLKGDQEAVIFVLLTGSFEVIFERMQQRSDHYMKAEMLYSQFADLETPENALTISINQSINKIVSEIIDKLGLKGK